MAASAQAFNEVSARVKPDTLQAFALYSDEGAATVCPAFATRRFFDELREEDPDGWLDYKYSVAEWPLEAEGAEEAFDDLCTLIREHVLTLQGEAFEEFRENLMATLVASAQRLRKTELADQGNDFLVLVTVSDGDEPEELTRRVQLLNSPAVAAEFEAWTRTWS